MYLGFTSVFGIISFIRSTSVCFLLGSCARVCFVLCDDDVGVVAVVAAVAVIFCSRSRGIFVSSVDSTMEKEGDTNIGEEELKCDPIKSDSKINSVEDVLLAKTDSNTDNGNDSDDDDDGDGNDNNCEDIGEEADKDEDKDEDEDEEEKIAAMEVGACVSK